MNMVVKNIPVRNTLDRPLTVVVEPWGDEYSVLPKDSLRVVFFGPADGDHEIHIADGLISIYGWSGSEVFVLKNNIELDAPTVVETIQLVLRNHKSIEDRVLQGVLSAEQLEYVQTQLDSSPSWDPAGRDVAIVAASKVAGTLVTSVSDSRFIWDVCRRVLQMRGVFWTPDSDTTDALFHQLNTNPEDFYTVLSKRLADASADKIAIEGWPVSN